jgi:hypothetical protein
MLINILRCRMVTTIIFNSKYYLQLNLMIAICHCYFLVVYNMDRTLRFSFQNCCIFQRIKIRCYDIDRGYASQSQ